MISCEQDAKQSPPPNGAASNSLSAVSNSIPPEAADRVSGGVSLFGYDIDCTSTGAILRVGNPDPGIGGQGTEYGLVHARHCRATIVHNRKGGGSQGSI